MEPEAAGLRAALRWAGPGALLALGLALAACGGASTPATPLTPGLYSGTSATGQNLTVLTLADGTFWGASSSTPQASGTSTLTLARTSGANGRFSSFSATTYALPGTSLPIVDDTKVFGSFTSNQILPTITLGSSSSSYTLSLLPLSAGTASLATLAGAYSDTLKIFAATADPSFTQPSLAMTIQDGSGAVQGNLTVAGTAVGTVTGTFTPRTDINAFNVNLSFNATYPPYTSGFTGYAFYDPDTRVLQLLARRPSDNPIGFFATGPN